MEFDNFIGIDWSGDKNKYQRGISVAKCEMNQNAPKIIQPKDKYWSRRSLIEWLIKEIDTKKTLIGFDFHFHILFMIIFHISQASEIVHRLHMDYGKR